MFSHKDITTLINHEYGFQSEDWCLGNQEYSLLMLNIEMFSQVVVVGQTRFIFEVKRDNYLLF